MRKWPQEGVVGVSVLGVVGGGVVRLVLIALARLPVEAAFWEGARRHVPLIKREGGEEVRLQRPRLHRDWSVFSNKSDEGGGEILSLKGGEGERVWLAVARQALLQPGERLDDRGGVARRRRRFGEGSQLISERGDVGCLRAHNGRREGLRGGRELCVYLWCMYGVCMVSALQYFIYMVSGD